MRRSIASTLLLLMVAALLAPAAVANVTSPVPACCRAGGPHHCAAMAASLGASGVRVEGQSCPYRKHLAFSISAAPPPATETIAPADPHPFLHEFYPELFVSQSQQAHPERAPPSSSMK
jgi:hypothetical protein